MEHGSRETRTLCPISRSRCWNLRSLNGILLNIFCGFLIFFGSETVIYSADGISFCRCSKMLSVAREEITRAGAYQNDHASSTRSLLNSFFFLHVLWYHWVLSNALSARTNFQAGAESNWDVCRRSCLAQLQMCHRSFQASISILKILILRKNQQLEVSLNDSTAVKGDLRFLCWKQQLISPSSDYLLSFYLLIFNPSAELKHVLSTSVNAH